MKTAAFAICFSSFVLASTAFGEEVSRCGRMSVRVVEDKQGEYTHRGQIYLQSDGGGVVLGKAFGSQGAPVVGCLRNSALVVSVGDPVEAEIIVVFFANGRSVSQLAKETNIEFRDGRAIVKQPIPLQFQDPANVPPDFRDLFNFL